MADKEKEELREHVKNNYLPDIIDGKREPKPVGSKTYLTAKLLYHELLRVLGIHEKKTEELYKLNEAKQRATEIRNNNIVQKVAEIRINRPGVSKKWIAQHLIRNNSELVYKLESDGVKSGLLSVSQ